MTKELPEMLYDHTVSKKFENQEQEMIDRMANNVNSPDKDESSHAKLRQDNVAVGKPI